MAIDARLRVSLAGGEFELEGSEEFIKEYSDSVRRLLQQLSEAVATVPPAPPAPTSEVAEPVAERSGTSTVPEFGEVLGRLPNGISGTEQILVAGFYASRRSSDKTFATADASKLLVEQGIKLTNPSQSLKNNMDNKRVFKAGKNFKLSREGVQHVANLIGIQGLSL